MSVVVTVVVVGVPVVVTVEAGTVVVVTERLKVEPGLAASGTAAPVVVAAAEPDVHALPNAAFPYKITTLKSIFTQNNIVE